MYTFIYLINNSLKKNHKKKCPISTQKCLPAIVQTFNMLTVFTVISRGKDKLSISDF